MTRDPKTFSRVPSRMTTPLRAAFRAPVPDRDGPTRRAGRERTTAVTRDRGGHVGGDGGVDSAGAP